MQLPGGAAWVPQTPGQLTPAATPNSAMPQAIAYPTMQQFQVSPQLGEEEWITGPAGLLV